MSFRRSDFLAGLKLPRLTGFSGAGAQKRRDRLQGDLDDRAVYAVGDVHGCLDQLLALEALIRADADSLPGRKLIIMLGDYIDRGPASAQVIDHLLASPPDGFDRICLVGNHEQAMLDYLEGRIELSRWLRMGAAPALLSYGLDVDRLRELYGSQASVDDAIRAAIPTKHRSFLRSLPILLQATRHLFVHAGIRPGVSLAEQSDTDLMTIRSSFHDQSHLLGHYVVHGHTPVTSVAIENRRINVDTGAYFSGRLSALRIWQGRGRVLHTGTNQRPATASP